MTGSLADLRRLAAEKALTHVESGMIIGLGSGTTMADVFLPLLAERIRTGVIRGVRLVPSSRQIEFKIFEEGLEAASFNQIDHVDVTIDSADLVERESLTAIKGGGGALLLEKVLSSVSSKMVLILDERKIAERIPPGFPIPVEVLQNLVLLVKKRVEKALGVSVRIRTGSGKVGPVITDSGNAIIDVPLPENRSLEWLDDFFNNTPGILENGIFEGVVSYAYVGTSSGVLELKGRRG
ncbi:MAG: ribose 5-phosphate isomerase A [Candidatus Brockarchaeota archaeon]|nr:ribose 5-phosphate isomerase A [Candidatus Brockarchaeota archaeon]